MKSAKTGIYVVEMFDEPPRPYRLWSGDLLECQNCHQSVVLVAAIHPIANHFEAKFQLLLEQRQPQVRWYEKPQQRPEESNAVPEDSR